MGFLSIGQFNPGSSCEVKKKLHFTAKDTYVLTSLFIRDTRHLKPGLHRYYLYQRPFIQSLCVDIDFNQTIGKDHCADEA